MQRCDATTTTTASRHGRRWLLLGGKAKQNKPRQRLQCVIEAASNTRFGIGLVQLQIFSGATQFRTGKMTKHSCCCLGYKECSNYSLRLLVLLLRSTTYVFFCFFCLVCVAMHVDFASCLCGLVLFAKDIMPWSPFSWHIRSHGILACTAFQIGPRFSDYHSHGYPIT